MSRAHPLVPRREAALFGAAVVGLALLPGAAGLSSYDHNLLTLAFLFVSGALAWNWVGGYLGQVSFGHAAMFGVFGMLALAVLTSPVAVWMIWRERNWTAWFKALLTALTAA